LNDCNDEVVQVVECGNGDLSHAVAGSDAGSGFSQFEHQDFN
jgi:hypothetical protein